MSRKKDKVITFNDMLNQWRKEWREFVKKFIEDNREEIIKNIEGEKNDSNNTHI